MKRPVTAVREWSSDPRSIGLIALGVVYIRLGVVCLPIFDSSAEGRVPSTLATLSIPFLVYSVLWIVSGAHVAMIGLKQQNVIPPVRWWMASTVAMPILWATFYFLSWAANHNLDWSPAILYVGLAVLVGSLILIPPARLYRVRQ